MSASAARRLEQLLPDAAGALRRLFGGAHADGPQQQTWPRRLTQVSGPLLAPIRAEIFGLERFADHGRSLGDTHRAERTTVGRATPFFPRLRDNIVVLRQAHEHIATHAAAGYDVSPAAEWLLDNFHIIEAQLEHVRAALPRSYFRALPVLIDEPLAGLPRIYGVAWAFVAHTDSAFDEDLLVPFLAAYQERRELQLGEMWALPTTLRVVLIENLRRLAERLAAHKAARELANLCCDRAEGIATGTLVHLLTLMHARGAGKVFLLQLAQRQHDHNSPGAAAFRPWLQAALPDAADALAQHIADQTADNLSVSNAVRSLRAIGDADWPDLVARSSVLMRMMLAAPQFEAEHTTTRDQALHAIERLARRSRRSEVEVAQVLLGLMHSPPDGPAPGPPAGPRRDDDTDDARRTAIWWLCDGGRPVLERALHLPVRPWRTAAARRVLRRLRVPAYLAALAVGTAGALAAAGALSPGAGSGVWNALVLALLCLPASEAAIAIINRLISESMPPRPLPRLALPSGVPPEHRVLVVVPALLSSPAATATLAARLRLHHLANPEAQAQFALLTDFQDAATEHAAGDDALLNDALAQIARLNGLHPLPPIAGVAPAPRFILLHRARRESRSEGCWMGWERKRGKLEQLVAELAAAQAAAAAGATGSSSGADTPGSPAGADPPVGPAGAGAQSDPAGAGAQSDPAGAGAPGARAFLDFGEASRLAGPTPYVVTLDSDTRLPPGRLRELVGVAAHPLNRPRLDATGRRVLAGYAILQPRIATPLPARGEATPFHALFAGQCGIDPYSAASSEVYQDLFGEGSFSGKGLLQVQAVNAVLGGRLPEGRVLSHDLLEGGLARCASVSDIRLLEDAPFHADVAAARVHRWTRGDWQLLPFLAGRPGRGWRLGALLRWKLFDNLRRSLVAPLSLAALLLALAGVGGVAPGAVLALLLAAYGAGPLLGAVAGFAPSRDDIAVRHFYRQAAADLAQAGAGALWHLVRLPAQALAALDAIVRALWRMTVSKRLLLQWTTAEAAEASAPRGLQATLVAHQREPLLALGAGAALWAAGTPHPGLSALLCALWLLAPLASWWASRPRGRQPVDALQAAQRAELEAIARDTWHYFERSVGPADRHLPPDNVQTTPHEMVAHRTSPTNIGLYLLATACALEFGFITLAELLARLEATLDTLDTLPRHRGHFLNWYDTQTGQALLPQYVSTVDSGNLSGHLLAVAQACQEQAGRLQAGGGAGHPAEALAADRLLRLAKRCETLAWEPDFAFLYHRRRHLLHIGWRVAEATLDDGFYDLLASESRLTSLLAIAKGDLPVQHWAALGRPFFGVGAHAGLRSWSGSMFEYLMPTLVLAEPPGSALAEAGLSALHEQQAFAQAHGVPWGISESAYAGVDHTLAYQYAPQGVPRLALRRTPADEIVIAPYATALAAPLAPQAALANFAALQALAPRTEVGFVEALDFTASRQVAQSTADRPAAHSRCVPVRTAMAHHQGMSLVALANLLRDGVAQRWGMASPHLQAVASLLHERAPREVLHLHGPPGAPLTLAHDRRATAMVREVPPGSGALEPTLLLGNGHYAVTLRPQGAGTSRFGTADISRWRDDALRDEYGSFLFLRWSEQPQAVSLTQHPAPDAAAHYHCSFHADRAVFTTTWPRLMARMTVWVSPEDDIEFRQVELHNLSGRPLDIELLSAFEPTLTTARADEAHPVFSNLFVRAEWRPAAQALVFERRPRLAGEPGLVAAHFLAETDPQVLGLRVQTDRALWRGRNRTSSQVRAHFGPLPQAARGEVGLDTGLDPVCAIAVRLAIAPDAVARLTFATAASADSAVLRAVIDKYRQPSHVQRASLMSATLAGIRLREWRLGVEQVAAVQALTTALVLTLARPLHAAADPAALIDRRLLWRLGISGDRPVLLVTVSVVQGLGLLRTLAQALRLWAAGGVGCDLVVVNSEPTSYQMALQREVAALAERHAADRSASAALSSLHALRAEELSAAEMATLQALARLQIHADGRPLVHHVQAWLLRHEHAYDERHAPSRSALPLARSGAPTPSGVPLGAFDEARGEFRFEAGALQRPARPWVNVLANASFGAHLSEAGGGHSWALNSRLNQLTAGSNDPLVDPPSEWWLLQDLASRQAWSVAPSAWGDERGHHRIAHGQGYSRIAHRRGDVDITVTWCVDPHCAVKQIRLQVVNRGSSMQRLRAIGLVEWMMGEQRSARGTTQTAVMRVVQPALTALLCIQQDDAAGFGGGTAFLALLPVHDGSDGAVAGGGGSAGDWTCDRRELFDARGRLVLPDHFGQQQGAGLEPCAALSLPLLLAPGQGSERVFLLGWAATPAAARALATEAATVAPTQREQRVRAHWDALLGATRVSTPDPLFDALVNRWLLYQTVACRLWAKAGFYQAGGATGFRDQLQDTLALAWAAPGLLRAQILLCASRQFAEGDVQHWWHAPTGAGVRTHFSDDRLWLPHALAHYLRVTGDLTVLDEAVPFVSGPPVPDGAEDSYATPEVSTTTASLYEHTALAIDRSLGRGAHGLPLMGSGDWNDGMNRVGIEGRGESVWLGWFLCRLVADRSPLARRRGEHDRAARWDGAAAGWQAALVGPAWDGAWFRRAFFDDGSALGSRDNPEARIDLIAQAWAVLSGVAPAGLQRLALAAVEDQLVDRDAGLIRLLDPPLQHAVPSAGYIQAYPPGVRENGGQYTHAGVWALMAVAEAARAANGAAPGDGSSTPGDIVYRDFTYLSPAHRAAHPLRGPAYALEPYAVAGDVYSQPPYTGRGGWSWYTGAAAWLHRAAVESMFGLQLEAETLSLTPCLPAHWPRAELTLQRDGRCLRFVLLRGATLEQALTGAPVDAPCLWPGARLAWARLTGDACFVVPLLEARVDAPQRSTASV